MTTSNQLPANSREVDCAEVVIGEVSKDILVLFYFVVKLRCCWLLWVNLTNGPNASYKPFKGMLGSYFFSFFFCVCVGISIFVQK